MSTSGPENIIRWNLVLEIHTYIYIYIDTSSVKHVINELLKLGQEDTMTCTWSYLLWIIINSCVWMIPCTRRALVIISQPRNILVCPWEFRVVRTFMEPGLPVGTSGPFYDERAWTSAEMIRTRLFHGGSVKTEPAGGRHEDTWMPSAKSIAIFSEDMSRRDGNSLRGAVSYVNRQRREHPLDSQINQGHFILLAIVRRCIRWNLLNASNGSPTHSLNNFSRKT